MSVEAPNSDADLLDLIRIAGPLSVTELADAMEVTATAVRQRLTRLMGQSMIQREAIRAGRGRPKHRYSLTDKGLRQTGSNFTDLALTLWREIRETGDENLGRDVLRRISRALASGYAAQIQGSTPKARLQSLAELLNQRRIPVTVGSTRQPLEPYSPCLPLSESGRRGPKHLHDGENDVLRAHRQRAGTDAMPAGRRGGLPIPNRFVSGREQSGAKGEEQGAGIVDSKPVRERL